MIKYETSVLHQKYYEHQITVSHPVTHEFKDFLMYSDFNDMDAVQQLLQSVNRYVKVRVNCTHECPADYEKSGFAGHWSLHQMFSILKTIKFYRKETVKRYEVKEVKEEVEVDYTKSQIPNELKSKDHDSDKVYFKCYDSFESFLDAIERETKKRKNDKSE